MENTYIQPKQSPPYLMGLLCLLPLIGAFVGIALLLYGIFKYKDKWLIMIGIFGILFTVGIYSFLFYYLKNGKFSKDAFARIAQVELNSLVKNVEFYKMQHGQYPDRLQQLTKDDPMVAIVDPIQTVQQRDNKYFNYENLGEHYLLFSSGQDGIPNTSDDLFPQVVTSDSSRIGWVRSRLFKR